MPGAVIVADQPAGAGAGVPGTARDDLWLSQPVNLSVATSGNSSYQWDLLDKPPGSGATVSTPTLATSGFTPDLVGTYRIRLVTNGGGAGNVQILVFRVRYTNVGFLADRGWALPALGESGILENNYGSNLRGYDEVFRFIFADLLPWAGGLSVLLDGGAIGQRRTINFLGGEVTEDILNDRIEVNLAKLISPTITGAPVYQGTRTEIAQVLTYAQTAAVTQVNCGTVTLPNEVSYAIDVITTCRRRTNNTKRGRWKFSALVSRTGGGPAVLDVLDVGAAFSLNAGTVTCDVNVNDFRVRVTPADTDPRNWDTEMCIRKGTAV